MSKQFTYNKNEKLKSRKLIEHVFNNGKSFTAFPIKVVYDFVDDVPVALQAGVTVSSRTFKKAVQRNRVKRVLREAYRLQKLPLQSAIEKTSKHIVLFFIYIGKELPAYGDVYEKMRIVLQKIHEKI